MFLSIDTVLSSRGLRQPWSWPSDITHSSNSFVLASIWRFRLYSVNTNKENDVKKENKIDVKKTETSKNKDKKVDVAADINTDGN